MFPHMLTKAVITTADKKMDRDNVIIVNALDLKPLLAIATNVTVRSTFDPLPVDRALMLIIHSVFMT